MIQQVCQQFGKQVELVLHDEMAEDGQKFMKEKGLTGHLPTAIYVNGSLAHKIDDRVVVFRDFVGRAWTGQDLQQVIELNLNGKKPQSKRRPEQPRAGRPQWAKTGVGFQITITRKDGENIE